MDAKINCWQFTCCGREPGGVNVHELGICPATIAKNCDGIHGGICGGRACWAISGTLCNGKVQGTIASKFKNCIKCAFYQAVLEDHSDSNDFLSADQIIARYQPDDSTSTNGTDTPLRTLTALIRADDPVLRTNLRQFLEKLSCQVIEAANSQETIDLTVRMQPDVILLSLSLPDMESFATFAAIRQLDCCNEIPAIFISESDSRAVESQGFKLGALAVVHTGAPNFWDELDQKLARVMRLKLRMSGLSALLIDTDPISRRIISACLRQQGVTVLCAETETEAQTIIMDGQTIDLVISEVYSPQIDGLGLCHYLRKQPDFTATPIILLCPEQFRGKILELFQAGATDYIIKPCPREELLTRLLIHIESQQRLKELSQEAAKNKLLLDSVGEGIVGIDINGHITFVNQAAARMLGYLQGELLGKNLHGMTHYSRANGENFSSTDCPIQHSLEHGKVVTSLDDLFWRSDNSSLPVKYISTPIINNDNIDGAVVAFSDITAEKREEALRHDIERITRHDLKTPLNGIIGIPGLLLEDSNLTDRQRSYLELLKDSGYRMLEMINDSLNLFKMEKGTYEFSPTRVDLMTIIRSILDELVLLKDKAIGVKITMDGRPSEMGQYFMVQGEELLCYSMFANLLKNAVEASPPGGTIDITMTHGEPAAEIIIHNQGAVPKEIRGRFFDKYSTAGKSGGTGLGTYSAKLITETQKGAITMATDEADGTSLFIKLPVVVAHPQGA